MKAITVQQPWAWAICHAGKRVENRAWRAAPGLVAQARRLAGHRIAIHAGLGGTRSDWLTAIDFMIDRRLVRSPASPSMPRLPDRRSVDRGAIVATATLADLYEGGALGHRRHDFGRCALCGQENPTQRELLRGAPLGGGQCPKRDPWAMDINHWLILDDVRPLPRPVPFKGALGFFEVPDGAPCGER